MSEEYAGGTMKEMIEATMVSYEERKVANTPIWVIENEIGILMPEFRKLPVNVQYILIRQNDEIAEFHGQLDEIREHLDRTPI